MKKKREASPETLHALAAIEKIATGPIVRRKLTAPEVERVKVLLDGAWASETKRAYRWGWATWESWAAARGDVALPADPHLVALFIEEQIARPRSASALRTILAAIRWAHETAGKPSPTYDPAVKIGWKSASRRLGLRAKHPKDPATLDVVERMLVGIDRTTLRGMRDAAVLLVGFHAALRRSELAAIRVEHWRPIPGGIGLLIPKSKTDQAGEGEIVGIVELDDELCAVRAVADWRQASGVDSGLLFRAFNLDGTLRETFGGAAVAEIVKARALAARLDPRVFGGHSLRAGFVTEAYRRGAQDAEIMGSTRHRSSTTLARYRREADPIARGASGRMRKAK